MPYQISSLAVLVLVRHVKARPRARGKSIVSPRLGEFATGHVELLDAGKLGERDFVGGKTDDGAILRVGLRHDKATIARDFIKSKPFACDLSQKGARNVPER